MTDTPSHPDRHDEAGDWSDRGATMGRPRWKSVAAIAVAVLVVAVLVALHLTGVVGPAGH